MTAPDEKTFQVRISKVRFKDGSSDLVMLPNREVMDEDADTRGFIWTLVWLLQHARAGRVLAYGGGAIVKIDDRYKEIEFGQCEYPGDRLELVGLLEAAKLRILREAVAAAGVPMPLA
jgi:hypothetical protein